MYLMKYNNLEGVIYMAKISTNISIDADIKAKAQELVDMSIEKGSPILRDAAEEVRLKAVDVTKEVLKKLENKETKKNKSKKETN